MIFCPFLPSFSPLSRLPLLCGGVPSGARPRPCLGPCAAWVPGAHSGGHRFFGYDRLTLGKGVQKQCEFIWFLEKGSKNHMNSYDFWKRGPTTIGIHMILGSKSLAFRRVGWRASPWAVFWGLLGVGGPMVLPL